MKINFLSFIAALARGSKGRVESKTKHLSICSRRDFYFLHTVANFSLAVTVAVATKGWVLPAPALMTWICLGLVVVLLLGALRVLTFPSPPFPKQAKVDHGKFKDFFFFSFTALISITFTIVELERARMAQAVGGFSFSNVQVVMATLAAFGAGRKTKI